MTAEFLIVDDDDDRLELIGGVIRHFAKRRGTPLEPSQFRYVRSKDEAINLIETFILDGGSQYVIAFIYICLDKNDDRGGVDVIQHLRKKLGQRCFIVAVSGIVTASEIGFAPYDRFISLHPQNHNYKTQIEGVLDETIFVHA